jgi:NAD+ synthase (glutamine-hydrolysing)
MGRTRERIAIFEKAAKTVAAPLVMANQVGAQDGLIFDGHSFHINEKGELLQIAKGFEEDLLSVDLHVHVCPIPLPEKEVEELHGALVLGLRDYFHKQGFEKAILGLSGGIDSAVVAALAVRALGAENVRAVAMPSRFSSPESFLDAAALARRLNISIETIDIEPLFFAFLQTLEPLFGNKKWDQTEENLQARIRGTLLMALSNQSGALLLNTSNKSELALGYSTLYGDLNGAIGPLVDVRKGLVYKLASFINREEELIPRSILEKEPTAELREGQKDTDTLPSYAVLDQVIELYIEKRRPKQEIAEALGVSFSFVEDVVKKIHRAEFKRRQAPLGLRVTEKSFSTGRVVPIVQKWT